MSSSVIPVSGIAVLLDAEWVANPEPQVVHNVLGGAGGFTDFAGD